jgi:hypothetical protein
MLTLRDDTGECMFNVIQITLSCKACRAAGKAESCKHNAHFVPPWKSEDRVDLVSKLYGSRKDLLYMETLGIEADDLRVCFRSEWIAKAWAQISTATPQTVFVSYDPCGGGASAFSLCSLFMHRGGVVLLGCDEERARTVPQVLDRILTHMQSVRRLFPGATIVFVPESNLGLESSHAHCYLKQRVRNYKCISEKNKPGVLTTASRKEAMVKHLEIMFMKNAVCLHKKRFTGTGAWKKMKQQLETFKRVRRATISGYKVILTGKDGHLQDDLAMAVLLGAYFAEKYVRNLCSFI